jgi:carbon storage regulator
MLVLSRKEGERLVIGDRIIVTVVHVEGGRVKLGVEAPREIGIWREEIHGQPTVDRTNAAREHGGESPLFAECW